MTTHRSSPRLPVGGECIIIGDRPVPYGSGVLPADFPERLTALKEATGLSWNGFAEFIGVDIKQVLRWRAGAEPCGGAMMSMFRQARFLPDGQKLLLPEHFMGRPGGV